MQMINAFSLPLQFFITPFTLLKHIHIIINGIRTRIRFIINNSNILHNADAAYVSASKK